MDPEVSSTHISNFANILRSVEQARVWWPKPSETEKASVLREIDSEELKKIVESCEMSEREQIYSDLKLIFNQTSSDLAIIWKTYIKLNRDIIDTILELTT